MRTASSAPAPSSAKPRQRHRRGDRHRPASKPPVQQAAKTEAPRARSRKFALLIRDAAREQQRHADGCTAGGPGRLVQQLPRQRCAQRAPAGRNMDCYVYVLGTLTKNRHLTYVGWTDDVARRLAQHNSGKGARTTRGRTWVLLYSERFATPASRHEPRMAPQARPRLPKKTGAEAEKRTRWMSIFRNRRSIATPMSVDPVSFPYGDDIEYEAVPAWRSGRLPQLRQVHEVLRRQPMFQVKASTSRQRPSARQHTRPPPRHRATARPLRMPRSQPSASACGV